jgi:predicted NBD/HSP70 family sugar kinase
MSGALPVDRHELVRRANIEAVVRAVAAAAPVTRDEIGAATGLSRPTVASLVAALVAQGRVRAVDAPAGARRGAGRVAVRYEVNPGASHVVGIDVGGTTCRAAVADLSGRILAEESVRTTKQGGAAVVSQIAGIARSVAEGQGIAWRDVEVVSIGTPGVRNDDGSIRLADNVPGLDVTPLATELEGVLGRRVVWENDVNVAAVGEHRAGIADGCRSFVLISVGTGLGMGIVIDGEVVRGSRGAAGEVAFLPIGGDPARARSRRVGTFEVAAAGAGVVQLYRDECGSRPPARGTTARDVYAAAGRGERPAVAAVARHADLLARGVLAVSAILDPELVVLGGGIGSDPVLLEPLRAAVGRLVSWPLRVEASALGARAGVVGAVHLGLAAVPRVTTDAVSPRRTATAGTAGTAGTAPGRTA